MIKKIDSSKMDSSNLGWLKALFHFSFADYYDPDNIDFGVLRVLNDVPLNTRDAMEIIEDQYLLEDIGLLCLRSSLI